MPPQNFNGLDNQVSITQPQSVPLASSPAPQIPPVTQNPIINIAPKKNSIPLVIAVAGVIIFTLAICFLLFNNSNNKTMINNDAKTGFAKFANDFVTLNSCTNYADKEGGAQWVPIATTDTTYTTTDYEGVQLTVPKGWCVIGTANGGDVITQPGGSVIMVFGSDQSTFDKAKQDLLESAKARVEKENDKDSYFEQKDLLNGSFQVNMFNVDIPKSASNENSEFTKGSITLVITPDKTKSDMVHTAAIYAPVKTFDQYFNLFDLILNSRVLPTYGPQSGTQQSSQNPADPEADY